MHRQDSFALAPVRLGFCECVPMEKCWNRGFQHIDFELGGLTSGARPCDRANAQETGLCDCG